MQLDWGSSSETSGEGWLQPKPMNFFWVERDTEVLRAELLMDKEMLQLALDLGLCFIILEKDSRIVFENFENSSWERSYN